MASDHGEALFSAATRPVYDHVRGVEPLTHPPSMRRGQAGSMPLGQPTKRLSGAFAGIPQSADSSAIGEAAGGAAQAAAATGGYGGESGGGMAATSSGSPGSGGTSGGSAPGVTTSTPTAQSGPVSSTGPAPGSSVPGGGWTDGAYFLPAAGRPVTGGQQTGQAIPGLSGATAE